MFFGHLLSLCGAWRLWRGYDILEVDSYRVARSYATLAAERSRGNLCVGGLELHPVSSRRASSLQPVDRLQSGLRLIE